MNTTLFNILWFSCQGTSRDIVYQSSCWLSWLIFAQHGLYGILPPLYSALSRLTDHGIYYITRCRIWLLTIFHISFIHFQRELRKATQPKWYLSFFVQYISNWQDTNYRSPWVTHLSFNFFDDICINFPFVTTFYPRYNICMYVTQFFFCETSNTFVTYQNYYLFSGRRM